MVSVPQLTWRGYSMIDAMEYVYGHSHGLRQIRDDHRTRIGRERAEAAAIKVAGIRGKQEAA